MVLLFLILYFSPMVLSQSQSFYLDPQNQVRSTYNLDPLVWDQVLAQMAQNITNGCVWGVSNPTTLAQNYATLSGVAYVPGNLLTMVGQNLGWSVPNGAVSVGIWLNKNGWNCWTGGCTGDCGSYTQVVWKDTARLGCAVARCSTGNPQGSGSWDFLLCLYNPPGNVGGQHPFGTDLWRCNITSSQTPSQTPAQTPSQTSQTPSQTSQTPSQTSQTPSQTSQTPSQTSQTPSQTSQTPSQTSQTPSQTSQTPSQTSQTPSQTSQTPGTTVTAPGTNITSSQSSGNSSILSSVPLWAIGVAVGVGALVLILIVVLIVYFCSQSKMETV